MTNKHKNNSGESAASTLADQLLELILERGLRNGDKLPGEVELAAEFQVSRLTVREAINGLKFLGILKSAPRRGTEIAELDYSRLSKYLAFQIAFASPKTSDLMRARLALELGSLELALPVAPEAAEKLYELADGIQWRDDSEEDSKRASHSDFEFHHYLLELSKNPLMTAFSSLIDIFLRFYAIRLPNAAESKRLAELHRMIARAIIENNLDLARGLLIDHGRHYLKKGK